MLSTQDPITTFSAPKAKSPPLASAAWLRVELKSGRRFEIAPVEQYFKDERYPRLAISIEQVQTFKEVRSWPGGPVLEWETPQTLNPLLGLSVHGGVWLRLSADEPPEGYEATLSNGLVLRVWHSQASPMSVEFSASSASRGAA